MTIRWIFNSLGSLLAGLVPQIAFANLRGIDISGCAPGECDSELSLLHIVLGVVLAPFILWLVLVFPATVINKATGKESDDEKGIETWIYMIMLGGPLAVGFSIVFFDRDNRLIGLILGLLVAFFVIRSFQGKVEQRQPFVSDSEKESTERRSVAISRDYFPETESNIPENTIKHVAKSNAENIAKPQPTVPNPAVLKSIDGVVIIALQQYEDGPWWARAFPLPDAMRLLHIITMGQHTTQQEYLQIRRALDNGQQIADRFVDQNQQPLGEFIGDSRLNAITECEQLLSRNGVKGPYYS
jgi:hypothetical protein